eukprot:923290-Amphidinium_carterae.1
MSTFVKEVSSVMLAWAAIIAQLTLVTVLLIRKYITSRRRANLQLHSKRLSIGFFHPYCAAGGGGDTSVAPAEIISQAVSRFGVE